MFWLFSVYCSVVTKQFSLHDKNTILITVHYVLAVFRWHTFRSLCDSSRKLDLVLEVTADIPSEEAIQRWMAEPVKAIIVSTKLFMTNKKGYPVLSKPHQALIRRLYKVTCWTFFPLFVCFGLESAMAMGMLLRHGRICALQIVIIIQAELNRDRSWRVVGVSMKYGPLVLSRSLDFEICTAEVPGFEWWTVVLSDRAFGSSDITF